MQIGEDQQQAIRNLVNTFYDQFMEKPGIQTAVTDNREGNLIVIFQRAREDNFLLVNDNGFRDLLTQRGIAEVNQVEALIAQELIATYQQRIRQQGVPVLQQPRHQRTQVQYITPVQEPQEEQEEAMKGGMALSGFLQPPTSSESTESGGPHVSTLFSESSFQISYFNVINSSPLRRRIVYSEAGSEPEQENLEIRKSI